MFQVVYTCKLHSRLLQLGSLPSVTISNIVKLQTVTGMLTTKQQLQRWPGVSPRLVLHVLETSCIRMVYQVVIFGNTTEKVKPSVSLCLNYTCVETGRDVN